MPMSNEQKLIVLRLIEQNKKILFGKRNPSLTEPMKMEAWRSIVTECKEKYGSTQRMAAEPRICETSFGVQIGNRLPKRNATNSPKRVRQVEKFYI